MVHIHSHSGVSAVQLSSSGVTTSSDAAKEQQTENAPKSGQQLSESERKQLQELKSRDLEVRAHERAHAAAAGSLAKGAPSFEYQRGPDGRLYAVGGEVQIDTSPVPGDAEATLQKAQQIRRAALAPADPSSQDRAVAAQALAMAVEARAETMKDQNEEGGMDNLQNSDTGGVTGNSELGESVAGEQVSTVCATCGGKHSVEAHSAATAYQYVNSAGDNPEGAGQFIRATA